MSKKHRTPPTAVANKKLNLFSDKERALIHDDLKDPQIAERNITFLIDMLSRKSDLKPLLFEPTEIIYTINQHLSQKKQQSFLTKEDMHKDDFIQKLITQLSSIDTRELLLGILIPIAKSTKIKREKRVLLWSAVEIIENLQSGRKPENSRVVQAVSATSVKRAYDILLAFSHFIDGKAPLSFHYRRILDDTWTFQERDQLLANVQPYEHYFTQLVSLRALYLLKKIKQPFGYRFYNVIHYPLLMELEPFCQMSMNEQPIVDSTRLDDYPLQAITHAVQMNVPYAWRWDIAKRMLHSIVSAAPEEEERKSLEEDINMAAFSMISLFYPNDFIFNLYLKSGHCAEEINPEDERALIVDIKSNPRNYELYQRYAELLVEKQEFEGAYIVYNLLASIPECITEQLIQRHGELHDQMVQKIRSSKKSISS